MGKRVLAIDLGASSGRAILGTLKGDKLSLTEIHRFSNDPVILNGTMYWDVLRLFHEIKQSLIKSKEYGAPDSIAIDTWGVDFGLLDSEGRLLENPVHYRDGRTAGMTEKAFGLIDKEKLYAATGNQIMEINTAFQLLSLKEERQDLIERADKLLLMPDLFAYFLCGNKRAERSIASTTQLFDQHKKDWSYSTINALGIKESLFPPVIESGCELGMLSDEICKELDIPPCKVISVCGHDTQSAQVAVPAEEKDFAFLSSGTWSLLGTEIDEPIINESSAALNVTNEQGFGGKTSFLKNIIGLWLIQESRRQWIRKGKEYSFAELEKAARAAEPFKCFIDPDAPIFTPSGNIPLRIKEYCKDTSQPVPESVGEIMRCIYESLAMKYRYSIAQLEECTQKRFNTLYVIGGGTKDGFLSELTASACKIKVSGGPVEATALGNIAVQLIAHKEIADLAEARRIISRSEKIYACEPKAGDWDTAYERFLALL